MLDEPILIQLHLEAAKNIDERCDRLVSRICKVSLVKDSKEFPLELPITAKIAHDEVLGEIEVGSKDRFGRWVSRFFEHEAETYALHGVDYEALRDIVDLIFRNRQISSILSREFVEDSVFDWCKRMFRFPDSKRFSAYFQEKAGRAVRRFRAIVPISFFAIQRPMEAGPCRIIPITASMIDELENEGISRDDRQVNDVIMLYQKLRKEMQGLGAIETFVVGDSAFAYAEALRLGEQVVGMLRLFSEAAYESRAFCPCALKGRELVPKTSVLLLGEDNRFGWRRQGGEAQFWLLSAEQASAIEANGWTDLTRLINGTDLTEFQTKLKICVTSYSRAICHPDLGERVVGILSSLEGILLKDSSEPIQQNLGERVAFALRSSIDDRRKVVENLKQIYNIRSKYVHHRQNSFTDEDAIQFFYQHSRQLLDFAIGKSKEIKTTGDFIAGIDRIKYGG